MNKVTGLRHFGLAVSFLTRIPVPDLGKLEEQDFGRAALFYPVVGLLLGLCLWLFAMLMPMPDKDMPLATLLAAAVMVTFWAVITGFLHLDGLADSADGWLGGLGDRQKTQRIMKDPLVGTAGAVSLVCVLLLKTVALASVLAQGLVAFVVFSPIVGRTLILLLFLTTPYVSSGGLARSVVTHLPRQTAWWLVVVVGMAAFWLSLWVCLLVAAGVWGLRYLMMQRLGGCTGDTVGAVVEISEMLWLIGVALFVVS